MSILHTFGILTHPDREWQTIREEHESTPKLFLTHVILLAIIPAAAAFYGTTQVGWQVGDGAVIRLSEGSAMQLCVMFYAAMLSGIFIIGKFIDFFAATYNVESDNGVTLAAYTATPLFLIGAIAVYPVLWVNMMAGVIAVCWSVYLLYEGLPILMKMPAERGFMFASSILTVGLVMLVGLFAISVIVWSIGIGPEYIS